MRLFRLAAAVPVLLFLLPPDAAPQAAEPVTLDRAIELLEAKSDALAPEIDKLAQALVKAHEGGPKNQRAADARAALLKARQQKDAAEVEWAKAKWLRRRPGLDAAEARTVEGWLEQARRLTAFESDSVPWPSADYTAIDKYARAVPKEAEESIEALAAYLAKGAKNEREKARAVFIWVTENLTYDMDSVRAKTLVSRAGDVFKSRATVCAGYANLYEALAKAAGLEAVAVSGWHRGVGGDAAFASFTEKSADGLSYANHAWNVVKVDGRWQLVEPTFAGSKLKDNGRVMTVPRPKAPYFFADPEELILSHLPRDPRWQLLKTPLSRKDHETLPLLGTAFFELGMRLESHICARIEARKDLAVTFRAPPDVEMSARLLRDGKVLDSEPVLIQRQGRSIEARVTFPQAGTYSLQVHAHAREQAGGKRSPFPAIEYIIEASPGPDRAPRLPRSDSTSERECRVHYPLTGALKAGQTYPFVVAAPGATGVVIQAGKQSATLVPVGDGLFAGNIRPPAGDLTVSLTTAAQPRPSHPILQFKAE